MKTKTIFKMLAAAMLMPTMLLTTACSNNDDEIINGETANTKGYALPVTVNVTRGGDATRATFDGSMLNFSTGDKLFVRAMGSPAGKFAGTLDYDSETGKFSGTIMTQNEYSGTAEALLAATSYPSAALLPAGYDSYSYLTIEDEGTYGADLDKNIGKAFALTKAAAVEQFSDECADSYSNGFALSPQNAIVSFTISGLTANTEVAVLFKDNYDISATPVNVTTDESGVATFASAMHDNDNFDDYSLTVGGNAITLPANKTVVAGHIYNISRNVYPVALSAVTADYLGSVVTTDGNVYATVDDATAASKTAAAVIAYVSSTGHGLAIALADESSKANMGTLLPKINNMSHTPAVSDQTWKLPKEDEWKQMFIANGGSNSSYSGLNTAITNAGGSALQASDYWVAHNTSTSNMTKMTLSGGNASFGSGGAFASYYVRVGFAF